MLRTVVTPVAFSLKFSCRWLHPNYAQGISPASVTFSEVDLCLRNWRQSMTLTFLLIRARNQFWSCRFSKTRKSVQRTKAAMSTSHVTLRIRKIENWSVVISPLVCWSSEWFSCLFRCSVKMSEWIVLLLLFYWYFASGLSFWAENGKDLNLNFI